MIVRTIKPVVMATGIVLMCYCLVQCNRDTAANKTPAVKPLPIDTLIKVTKSYSLKNDMARYPDIGNAIEAGSAQISAASLPLEMLTFRKQHVNAVSITWMQKMYLGYLATFNIHYDKGSALVISTLDSTYTLRDYKIYVNGNGAPDVKADTIAIPRYQENTITVEVMHPNKTDEPEFKRDGIRKEQLTIDQDLNIIVRK